MAKRKMTITIDPEVLADVDTAARSAGLNRSEYVERVLRHEHYRQQLAAAAPAPIPEDEQRRLRRLLDWQRDPGRGELPHAA